VLSPRRRKPVFGLEIFLVETEWPGEQPAKSDPNLF
jgi:hypothetical protein